MKHWFVPCYLAFLVGTAVADRPLIIAHRGASGHVPEHTLAAAALAHQQGADFIEQDVVLTRDDVPIVSHDIHLDRVTDIAHRFMVNVRCAYKTEEH